MPPVMTITRLRRSGRSASRAPGKSANAEVRLEMALSQPICVFVAPSERAKGPTKLVTNDSEMFEKNPSHQKRRRPWRAVGNASASGL